LGAQAIYNPGRTNYSFHGVSPFGYRAGFDRYYVCPLYSAGSGTGQERVNEFAKHMEIPVINACSDSRIPARAFAIYDDLGEKKGLQRMKLVGPGIPGMFAFPDDRSALMGIQMSCPSEGFDPHPRS